MPVQMGTRGQPGFDEPIALMMDCHRRIEGFLAVLERVTLRCAEGPLDADAARALAAALEYFRSGAPNHTADEERSLFPALRELGRTDVAPLLEQAERLELQHQMAGEIHARVDSLGRLWLAAGSLDAQSLRSLRQDLAELRDLYSGHIAFEDTSLFPAAQRLLHPQTLERIGSEMAARRGVTPAGSARHTSSHPEPSASP